MSKTTRLAVVAILFTCFTVLTAHSAEPENPRQTLTPEQIVQQLPKETVTVRFRIREVGLQRAPIPEGQPNFLPIQLEAEAKFGNLKDRFFAVLVGTALTNVMRQLGVEEPAEHFRGKVVEVTGTVHSVKLPRITHPDGSIEYPEPSFTHYNLVIDDLKNFREVR